MAAGVLAIAVTLPFLDRAITNIVLLRQDVVPRAAADAAALAGIPPGDYGTAMVLTTSLLLLASAWTLGLAVGVLARRQWAREAALFTFIVFAMLLPLSIAGLLASPPAPNALAGVVAGVVDAIIVVLLAVRMTADDVERADSQRQSRRPGAAGSGRVRR